MCGGIHGEIGSRSGQGLLARQREHLASRCTCAARCFRFRRRGHPLSVRANVLPALQRVLCTDQRRRVHLVAQDLPARGFRCSHMPVASHASHASHACCRNRQLAMRGKDSPCTSADGCHCLHVLLRSCTSAWHNTVLSHVEVHCDALRSKAQEPAARPSNRRYKARLPSCRMLSHMLAGLTAH